MACPSVLLPQQTASLVADSAQECAQCSDAKPVSAFIQLQMRIQRRVSSVEFQVVCGEWRMRRRACPEARSTFSQRNWSGITLPTPRKFSCCRAQTGVTHRKLTCKITDELARTCGFSASLCDKIQLL